MVAAAGGLVVRTAAGMARPAAYSIGMVLLALLAGLGWRELRVHTVSDPVVRAETTAAVDPNDARLGEATSALRDPSISEERKLGILESIAADPDDEATGALLNAVESPSVLVSMAGIRALRGRPCGRVADPLVRRMAHGDWQCRAWAAKVLGENGCTSVAPELRRCLARERDARVRRQLTDALATLGARVAR